MARVLLIGPERQRSAGVRSLLRQDGHQVVWLRSADRWRQHEREVLPDLVVAAVGSDDCVLAPQPRSRLHCFPAPILFVQQESDFLREHHFGERLVDRLASPFMSEDFLGRVDALIRVRRVLRREPHTEDKKNSVSGSWGQLCKQVSGLLRPSLSNNERPREPYLEVAARVAEWADRRDAFEPGHAERVSTFSAMIAEGLDLGDQETAGLMRAAMLHDIGKVALPEKILHQKRPLDDKEKELIRAHPATGAALLRALDPDDRVARVILCHHECPDGAGYYGKHPEGVPKAAYALSVAEAYDAMISSQVRERLSSDAAIALLRGDRGTRYDADCVDALVDSLKPRAKGVALSSTVGLAPIIER